MSVKIFLIFTLTLLLITTSCKKETLAPSNPISLTSGSCLNQPLLPIENQSPFQKLVFFDDFQGLEPGEDPKCYTQEPVCKRRLDIHQLAPCPNNFDRGQIKDLNKCVWTLYDGFSIWEHTKQSSFHPSQIKVQEGRLILTTDVKRNNSQFDCGPKRNISPHSLNYHATNCLVVGGGVDTSGYSSRTPGRTFREGRIEFRARLTKKTGAVSAIWTWPTLAGYGSPHVGSPSWSGYRVNEFDLLESRSRSDQNLFGFQSIHDWGPPEQKHTARSGSDFKLSSNEWHVFGLERFSNRIRLYVDHCVTLDLQSGQYGIELTDWPQFIKIFQGAEFWWDDIILAQGATLEIDWVKIFEK